MIKFYIVGNDTLCIQKREMDDNIVHIGVGDLLADGTQAMIDSHYVTRDKLDKAIKFLYENGAQPCYP